MSDNITVTATDLSDQVTITVNSLTDEVTVAVTNVTEAVTVEVSNDQGPVGPIGATGPAGPAGEPVSIMDTWIGLAAQKTAVGAPVAVTGGTRYQYSFSGGGTLYRFVNTDNTVDNFYSDIGLTALVAQRFISLTS